MADYQCHLDAVGEQRAKSELGEIPTDREASVAALRGWVVAQSDWLKCPTDTQFLLAFLRHRKFSQIAARERIIKFCLTRTENPELFANLDIYSQEITQSFKQGIHLILPTRDKNGCTILHVRLGRLDPKVLQSDLTVLMRSLFAIFDNLLRNDVVQVCGIKILHDFTDVTIELVLRCESFMKKVVTILKKSYPIRLNATYFYNAGTTFDFLLTMMKPFLTKKARARVSSHANMQPLYEKIGMETLPVEYLPDDYKGPNAGPIDTILEQFTEEMRDKATHDYILNLSRGAFSCDRTKIPKDPVPTETFRSLEI